MIDLDKRHLSLVRKLLAEYIPDKTVWVYGSRIKGKAHEASDLDLVVMNSKKELSTNLSALRAAFSESHLPISVDILNWADIPKLFQDEINNKHEVLQVGEK